MSDPIKHECGIAMIRLLKPLRFYKEKYGTSLYGLNKLCLLMEKQHNRGQDGAGMANIKFDISPGNKYISIQKSNTTTPIKDIFHDVSAEIAQVAQQPGARPEDPEWLKKNARFTGELFLGHLRYGTYGGNGIERCHPFLRESNWMTRTLVVAGNFNLTNTDELFQRLVNIGQHPKDRSDTVTVLEKIGHYLDKTTIRMEEECIAGGMTRREAEAYIAKNLDVMEILRSACEHWDGGYVIAGLIGHGDSFVLRDPAGIRPAFYYVDDEVAVVTSERPVIQTTFNIQDESLIHELPPGHAIVIKRYGAITVEPYTTPLPEPKRCSFERIYFSRGSDKDIYKERKQLGEQLTQPILKAVDYDVDHTVFSYIPNTAEVAYYGMLSGFKKYLNETKIEQIANLDHVPSKEELYEILGDFVRSEKIAWKDIKLRTFITEGNSRNDLASHVYDVTYGSIEPNVDNLVIIDDSIVRGTTLKESILRILDRLHPKKIVVVSSAPQIRYPDYYGIDMARLEEFCVFRAAIQLLKERKMEDLIEQTYEACKAELAKPKEEQINPVRSIYKPFSTEEINEKIVEMLRPEGMTTPIQLVFQSIEGLREAIPNHKGDWYFTGHYPTPGGTKLCNQSFVNYIENVYHK